MTAIADTWALTSRSLAALAAAVVHRDRLIQPIIWLLLFGELFQASSRSPASRAATTSSTSFRACS